MGIGPRTRLFLWFILEYFYDLVFFFTLCVKRNAKKTKKSKSKSRKREKQHLVKKVSSFYWILRIFHLNWFENNKIPRHSIRIKSWWQKYQLLHMNMNESTKIYLIELRKLTIIIRQKFTHSHNEITCCSINVFSVSRIAILNWINPVNTYSIINILAYLHWIICTEHRSIKIKVSALYMCIM